MLETVRQYGPEKLAERGEAERLTGGTPSGTAPGPRGRAMLRGPEQMELFGALGSSIDIGLAVEGIAAALAAMGRAEEAARLLGAVDAHFETLHARGAELDSP
jgi:hypothetical protein